MIGGDVRVTATLDEITRVSMRLRQVEEHCRQLLATVDWTLSPEVSQRLRLMMVAEESAQLSARCVEARDQYYDLETGNASLIKRTTEAATNSLDLFTGPIANNPFLGGFRVLGSLALTAGAGIAGGLWGNGTAQVDAVRSAAQFAPRLFGARNPQSMLQNLRATLVRLGVPTETGNFAVPGAVAPVRPAMTISEHVQRLAHAYANPASGVTIERYVSEGGRQFVVYVPGTQSAGLGTVISAGVGKLNNPLDLRSNLNAMAGPRLAASEGALRQALRSAGAGEQPGDRVLFVGHSQGALISANIASEKQSYQVSGLISVAGPIGHLKLDGVPTLAIEHSDDPVPALSGARNPLNLDFVTVRAPSGESELVAAHSISNYQALTKEIDASQNQALRDMVDRIGTPTTSEGTSQEFLLRRISGSASEQTNAGIRCVP